jgi:hypothetical protein
VGGHPVQVSGTRANRKGGIPGKPGVRTGQRAQVEPGAGAVYQLAVGAVAAEAGIHGAILRVPKIKMVV